MINHRRWAALLLCTVMTVSSATVLAAGEFSGAQEPEIQAVSQTEAPALDLQTDPPQETAEPLEPREPAAPATETQPAQPQGIGLVLNGEALSLSVAPVALGGNTYVSLAAFMEAMGGAMTGWSSAGLLSAALGDQLVLEVQIGSDLMHANQRYFYMPDMCRLVDGVPMVPIRGMAKVFSLTVGWDADTQTVLLSGGQILAWADSYYSADDLLWLSRIIHAESRGEPLEGKVAVGNVVLNRMQSSRFPDTVYDVIFDGNGTQFSPVRSGAIYNEPSAECIKAAKLCLEGATEVEDALYFLNARKATSSWIIKNRTLVATIGSHSFYS